jgi:hypothetical protein
MLIQTPKIQKFKDHKAGFLKRKVMATFGKSNFLALIVLQRVSRCKFFFSKLYQIGIKHEMPNILIIILPEQLEI